MRIYELQADLCKALAHPIRMQVLALLCERERTVEELTKLIHTGQPNLSQHLAALRQQKLVTPRRAGLNVYYGLSDPKIAKACSMIRDLTTDLLEKDHRAAKMMEVSN
jgi:DNA-binding transcriptional ArsR family regulator